MDRINKKSSGFFRSSFYLMFDEVSVYRDPIGYYYSRREVFFDLHIIALRIQA